MTRLRNPPRTTHFLLTSNIVHLMWDQNDSDYLTDMVNNYFYGYFQAQSLTLNYKLLVYTPDRNRIVELAIVKRYADYFEVFYD